MVNETVKKRIHAILVDALNSAIQDGKFPEETYPPIKVEYPKEQKFGDYATPFAMESARVLRRSPVETGEILKEYIEKSEIIASVEVVKPGFINIFMSQSFLFENLKTILSEKDSYGKTTKETPQRVCIEFVSANPTGPLNIVSARAAAIGDTLANLFEACGDTVDREFYVNDYGNQVNLLGKSVLSRLRELKGEETQFPEDGYHGEYIKDIAAFINENFSSEAAAIEDEEKLADFMAEQAVAYNVKGQKEDLETFNVNFKNWFRERTLHEKGEVEDTLKFLESKEVIFTEEGKKVFRSTDFGDDKDRVVVRDDGRPTYLLADIAYHKDKVNRKYDNIINIWGPDHHGYIARLAGAMKVMGYGEDKFKVLLAQQVNLVMEGEAVKMSKRLGKFSTMKELLEDLGVDVPRYFFIMRSMDSHLDFDLALAKKESSENPVFYLQYAHARVCSVFKKAVEKEIVYDAGNTAKEHLDNPQSAALLKQMLKFSEEIIDAAETCEPHRIATYLMRLAQSFHKLYAVHRVLSPENSSEKINTYMLMLDCLRIVMKNGLTLLGVTAPERMEEKGVQTAN
ncbi:MAG: arginine--tRNA ligase [bacterium]|nr:arginine--tRNA ligase [bacterium]